MWIAAATCVRCRTVVASASLAAYLAVVPLALAGGGVDRKAPSMPTNLHVTAVTATSVTLAWDPVKDNKGGAELAGYGLYRGGVAVGTSPSTTYTFASLSCGTSSVLGADAYDLSGNRSPTASVTASTGPCATPSTAPIDTSPPTVPGNVRISATTGTSISLSWSASSDNVGVVGYGLYRGGTRVSSSSTTQGTVAGLSCGTSYTLGVDAVDAAGNRSALATINAGTSACAPSSGSTAPQPLGKPGNWTLSFDDEFSGTAVDRTKWSPYIDGWRCNNVTVYNRNVSVSGGNAVLKLVSTTEGAALASKPWDGSYTGYTLPVGSFTEARINFPGSGTTIWNWPAWWTSGPSWPAAGENDIAEGLGTMTVNYHSPSGAHNQGTIPGVWSNAFHVYGLYRGAGFAEVYYDGVLVKRYPTDDNGNGQALIVNIGSGHTAQVPSQLLVDYVRAWKP